MSEKVVLKRQVYLSVEQYNTLKSTGSVTVDGVTIEFSENDEYITPDTTGADITAVRQELLTEIQEKADTSYVDEQIESVVGGIESAPTENGVLLDIAYVEEDANRRLIFTYDEPSTFSHFDFMDNEYEWEDMGENEKFRIFLYHLWRMQNSVNAYKIPSIFNTLRIGVFEGENYDPDTYEFTMGFVQGIEARNHYDDITYDDNVSSGDTNVAFVVYYTINGVAKTLTIGFYHSLAVGSFDNTMYDKIKNIY